ncbi:MAG: hypothetical protein P9M07_04870 [Candidatus Aceula meridiana]|nr:hypothetical protein [Candidatus Aceula meridiana]
MKKVFLFIGAIIAAAITITVIFFFFIFVVNREGRMLGVLPDTSWIDGSQKVYVIKGHSLFSMNLQGRNEKKVCDNVDFDEDDSKISPDRTKILARTYNASTYAVGIVLIDLDSGKMNIIEKGQNCWEPAWFPDGNRFAYLMMYGKKLCIFNIKDGTKEVIDTPQEMSQLSVANDGKRIFLENKLRFHLGNNYYGNFEKAFFQYDLISKEITKMKNIKIYENSPAYSARFGKVGYIDDREVYWGPNNRGIANHGRVFGNQKITVYKNNSGSLMVKENGNEKLLVRFLGANAPGYSMIWPRGMSDDMRYFIFAFDGKIYISDIVLKKTGYLTDGWYAYFGKSIE